VAVVGRPRTLNRAHKVQRRFATSAAGTLWSLVSRSAACQRHRDRRIRIDVCIVPDPPISPARCSAVIRRRTAIRPARAGVAGRRLQPQPDALLVTRQPRRETRHHPAAAAPCAHPQCDNGLRSRAAYAGGVARQCGAKNGSSCSAGLTPYADRHTAPELFQSRSGEIPSKPQDARQRRQILVEVTITIARTHAESHWPIKIPSEPSGGRVAIFAAACSAQNSEPRRIPLEMEMSRAKARGKT
jgi:hypothetical protein